MRPIGSYKRYPRSAAASFISARVEITIEGESS